MGLSGLRRQLRPAAWVAAELDGLAGAGVDGAGVGAAENRLTDDVGDQEEDDLVLSFILSREEKKYLRIGISPRPGVPLMLSESVVVMMPARRLGSPSLSWMTCSATRWPMMGSVTPVMVTVAGLRGDLDLHLEGDLVVVVDGRGHVDVDADVDVGELGLNADAGDAGGDAGVVGAGGDGDLLSRS